MLSSYTLSVSELTAFFGSHFTRETYQNILFSYTILVLSLILPFIFSTVILSKDKLKYVQYIRLLKNMIYFFLFSGANFFLLFFTCIIQPAYFLFVLRLVIVKLVIGKWMNLQREVVLISYEEVEKKNLIGHYNRHGILFEMEEEPRIYREDYF